MSKWADEKDGKVILSIADLRGCNNMYNQICCDERSDHLRESPGEDECHRCEYFEMEDGNIDWTGIYQGATLNMQWDHGDRSCM